MSSFFTAARCNVLLGLLVTLSAGNSIAAERIELVYEGPNAPFGVDFDEYGLIYLVELTGHRVLCVPPKGGVTPFAGKGQKGNGGDGGPMRDAEFNGMHSLAIHAGKIYIADTWNNRVRVIDRKSGVISPFAGTGTKGFSGDRGPAVKAEFGGIYCVALDPKRENLVLTDLDNRRIRVVNLQTGIVKTVAGNGEKGKPQDGAMAVESPLVDPRAAVIDSAGNLYILERGGHALRVVDSSGIIRTLIGDGKGDTTLKGPKHLCIDRDGNVIIADTENHRIIKYLVSEKKTVRLAGTGEKGNKGIGGPPDKVQLNQPHGVTIGPDGKLLIVDSTNNRVLKIVTDA